MARQPSIPDLMDIIQELRREVKALQRATPLQSSAIGEGGQLRLAAGSKIVADPGATLNFDGDVLITGDLSVPNGSITNDALQNPVVQRSTYGNADGFAVPTDPAAKAHATATVPAGFSDAFFFSAVSAQLYNNTANTTYAYLRAYASGPGGYLAWGGRQMIALGAGFAGTLSAVLIREVDVPLTGGDTLTFYAEVSASSAYAFEANNYAFCEAGVTFTR